MRLAVLLTLLLSLPAAGQVSGSITSGTCNAGGCVTISTTLPGVAVQLSGTWVATLAAEGSNDAVTWATLPVWPFGGTTSEASMSTTGAWLIDSFGLYYVRVRATAYTSGTVAVTMQPTTARPVVRTVDAEVRNALTLAEGNVVSVIGADGGSVSMTLNGERVSLDSASLTALAAGTCTGFRGLKAVAPSAGVIEVPQLPDGGTEQLAGRTSLKVCNWDNSQDLHYVLAAPDAGVVDLLYPGLGDVIPASTCATFNVGPAYVVRASPSGVGNVNVSTLEAACPQ